MHVVRIPLVALALFLSSYGIASAHAVVSPKTAETNTYQTFSLSVPNEKDIATTKVELAIPEGLKSVMPVQKPGWKITLTKDANGNVTRISWSGNTISVDFKDVFDFTAHTPQQPTTLAWKAYQTYENGEVVAWDQTPSLNAETPYSVTTLTMRTDSMPIQATHEGSSTAALVVSVLALIVSVLALVQARTRGVE
jgi:uncharacterized protein YcnI